MSLPKFNSGIGITLAKQLSLPNAPTISNVTLNKSLLISTPKLSLNTNNRVSGNASMYYSGNITIDGNIKATTIESENILSSLNIVGDITGANLSGTNTGDVVLNNFGTTPNSKGADLSGQILTLQPADATHPGLITAASQNIGGNKTFINNVIVDTLDASKLVSTDINKKLVSVPYSESALAGTVVVRDSSGNINANNVTSSTNSINDIGAFSASNNLKGLSIDSFNLIMHPASQTTPGGISTASQTFGGDKTFSNDVVIAGKLSVNSNTLCVDSSNNKTGINTNTPSEALDVSGNINTNGNLIVDTNVLYVDSLNNMIGVNNSNPTHMLDVIGTIHSSGDITTNGDMNVANSTLFVNSVNNKIGINNPSPSYDLDVSGNIHSAGNLVVNINTLVVDTVTNKIGINNSTPSYELDVSGNIYSSGNITSNNALTVAGDLTVDVDTLYVDATNNKVGIKNSNPLYELDVNGHIYSSGNITSNSALIVAGDLTVDTNTLYVNATSNKVGVNNLNPLYELDVSGSINTNGTLTATGDMTVGTNTLFVNTTNNKTGVNISNPLYELDVSGNIHSSGSIISSSTLTVAGDLTVDSGTLYVNASNNKIGINKLNPSYDLDVVGSVKASTSVIAPTVYVDTINSTAATSGVINIGCGSDTDSINIGCSIGMQTINIGTSGDSNTTINIGGPNDIVNLNGTVNNVSQSNLDVTNKIISLNNGASGSGQARGAGLEIFDNDVSGQGFIKVSSTDGRYFVLKAPENAFQLSTPDLLANDTIICKNTTDTLTNKTLTSATINNATLSITDPSSNALNIKSVSLLSQTRDLTFNVNDSSKTITLGGNLTIGNSFTTNSNPITFNTTGTTAVTLPSTGTLATTNGFETFTNKTINTLYNTGGGTLTMPIGTDTLVGSIATQTLTNKSLLYTSNSFVDSIGNRKLVFDISGILPSGTNTSTLTIKSAHTASRTISLPNTSDTLVCLTFTQTLSGKTFSDLPKFTALTALQSVATDASQNLVSLPYSQSNSSNTIVQRDAIGNIAAQSLIMPMSVILSSSVTTTGLTPTILYTDSTLSVANTGKVIYFQIHAYNTTNNESGSYSGYIKAINVSGLITITPIVNYITALDATLTTTTVTATAIGSNVYIYVTGVASKSINWSGIYIETRSY